MSTTKQVLTSAALNASGLAAGVSGATFTLSATSASDSCGHIITVKNNTVNSHAGKTITVVGTDANGNVLSETITGPGISATVSTTGYFKTVTSITPSATIGADTFDLGWTAASVGPEFTPHISVNPFNVGIGCTVASGSPTYSIQYTYDRSAWFTHSTITGKTASFDGVITSPVLAARVAFTAAGGVTATYIQAGNK